MKEGIHPEYYQATVTCNCGNTFVTGSTKKDIHVEVCSKCHSFYTGQQKAARADGRIEKFNKKYGVGKFGLNKAFRVSNDEKSDDILSPITSTGNMTLDDLIGSVVTSNP